MKCEIVAFVFILFTFVIFFYLNLGFSITFVISYEVDSLSGLFELPAP